MIIILMIIQLTPQKLSAESNRLLLTQFWGGSLDLIEERIWKKKTTGSRTAYPLIRSFFFSDLLVKVNPSGGWLNLINKRAFKESNHLVPARRGQGDGTLDSQFIFFCISLYITQLTPHNLSAEQKIALSDHFWGLGLTPRRGYTAASRGRGSYHS